MRTLARSLALATLLLTLQSVTAQTVQDAVEAIARKDYAAAVRVLEPLARAGNPQAQLRLGLLYYHGQGVKENDARAFELFEQAAEKGLADAQFQLANMYAFGTATVPADVDPNRLAARWYFEAARQGHAEAQYSLGIMFLTGSGVVQSAEEANKWIARAAAQGHADAKAYQAGSAPRPPDRKTP